VPPIQPLPRGFCEATDDVTTVASLIGDDRQSCATDVLTFDQEASPTPAVSGES
jgi:hypothetical protein